MTEGKGGKAPHQHEPMSRGLEHPHHAQVHKNAKRHEGAQTRLILPFYQTASCCSVGPGLADNSLPPELAALGVKESDWFALVELLYKDVQSKRWTDCQGWAVGATIVGIPFLCAACAAYQSAAREWLYHLNTEILQQRGLYAKFQNNTFAIHGKNGQVLHHEERNWLAIALTPQEAAVLRAEPTFLQPECCKASIMVPSCGGDHGDNCACCCFQQNVL